MKAVAMFFILIGLVMGGVAGKFALETQDFIGASETVPAKVVGLNAQQSSKANSQTASYRAIYGYKVGAKSYTSEAQGAFTSPGPHVGDEHVIRYKTEDPEYVRRDSLFGLWGKSIIIGGIGVPFLLAGFIVMLGAGRMGSRTTIITQA